MFGAISKVGKKPFSCAAVSAAALVIGQSQPVAAQDFGFYWGADFTSNYLSKGFTQTDDEPAFQPWLELGYGIGYFGLWASNVNFGSDDIELDVSIGARPSYGNFDMDIGFVQYFYRDDSTDYGEAYFYGSYNINDSVSIGAKFWYEVYHDYYTVYAYADYALPSNFTISGGLGSDFGSRELPEDAVYGDLGVSYDFGDHFAIDLRWNYSEIEGDRVVGTFSIFN